MRGRDAPGLRTSHKIPSIISFPQYSCSTHIGSFSSGCSVCTIRPPDIEPSHAAIRAFQTTCVGHCRNLAMFGRHRQLSLPDLVSTPWVGLRQVIIVIMSRSSRKTSKRPAQNPADPSSSPRQVSSAPQAAPVTRSAGRRAQAGPATRVSPPRLYSEVAQCPPGELGDRPDLTLYPADNISYRVQPGSNDTPSEVATSASVRRDVSSQSWQAAPACSDLHGPCLGGA